MLKFLCKTCIKKAKTQNTWCISAEFPKSLGVIIKTRVSILFKDGKALSAKALLVLLRGLIYAQIFLQHSQRKKGYAVVCIVYIKLHSLAGSLLKWYSQNIVWSCQLSPEPKQAVMYI